MVECEDGRSLWLHASRPPSLYLVSFPCLKTKYTCLKTWTSWRIKVFGFLWTAVVVGCERYSVVLRFKSIFVKCVWNLRACGCVCEHYWRLVCDIACFAICQRYGGTCCLGFRVKMVEDGRRRLLWNFGIYLRNYAVPLSKRRCSAAVSPDLKFSQWWWWFQSWGTGRRRWREQALPKHLYVSAKLHCIRSGKP
jgi:hypothetical protein